MPSSRGRFYEFGPFQLDTFAPLLWREGEPVPLTPKALETLVVLVQHAGRLVKREVLIDAVWPDTAVEENNLSVNVSLLRKILGKDEGGKQYIETVQRRGYRFTAPVRDVFAESGEFIFSRQTQSHIVTTEDITTTVENGYAVTVTGNLPSAIRERVNNHQRKNGLVLALSVCLAAAAAAYIYISARPKRKETIPAPTVRSIAVLPLKAITTDEADETLRMGLADSLITRLGNSQKIIVRPLTSITKYAGTEYDALEVGRKLQVDAILDGSFQRDDKRLRVRVRLLRVADGQQIWVGTFDEIETDIFKLQDAISLEAASALALNLNQPQRELILKRYTENIEAYQAYLRGRYFVSRYDEDGLNLSRAFAEYERAIQLDPDYALAYAGLSDAYSHQANISSGDERKQFYEKSKKAALTALAFDENLAEAHGALGWIRRIYDWNWVDAEKHMKRAVELAPNEAAFQRHRIFLLITLGRTEEAVTHAQKCLVIDPAYISGYAMALSANGQFDEAIAQYQKIVEMNEDLSTWHALAQLYLLKGNYVAALDVINRAPPNEQERFRTKIITTLIYFHSGDKAKAGELLRKLEAKAKMADGRDVRLAAVYASMGRKEDAIAALQKGFTARDDRLMWIKTNPHFDSLRGDPRFQEILRNMKL